MIRRVPFRLWRQRWHGTLPIARDSDYHELSRVRLDDLYATQGFITHRKQQHESGSDSPDYEGMWPVVVNWAGRMFIQDGHHRLARLKLAGRKTARAVIVSIARPIMPGINTEAPDHADP